MSEQRAPQQNQQDVVTKWAIKCFGAEHVYDPKVRAVRLVEEAIEFAQSVGADPAQLQALVDYVYNRAPGKPFQELGGVGVTMLAAASSIGVSTDVVIAEEIKRVLAKSPEHFAARNQHKIDHGFTGAASLPESQPSPSGDAAQELEDILRMLVYYAEDKSSQWVRQRSLYDALMTWHAAHCSGTVSPLDGSVGNTTITLSSLHHRATTADKSVEYSLSSSAKVSGQAEQRLREALQQCAIKFREYATIHGQKEDTPENREKVKANRVMAELAEAALQESPSDTDAKKGLL